jgi:single-stranded DNA-binding protein
LTSRPSSSESKVEAFSFPELPFNILGNRNLGLLSISNDSCSPTKLRLPKPHPHKYQITHHTHPRNGPGCRQWKTKAHKQFNSQEHQKMNTIALQGILASAIESRQLEGGTVISSFIAQFNPGKTGEEDFKVRVIGFGNLGQELSQKDLPIGAEVFVEGSIRNESRTQADGSKLRTTEIIARKVFCHGSHEPVSAAASGPASTPTTRSNTRSTPPTNRSQGSRSVGAQLAAVREQLDDIAF